jgi:hypothetical protein
MYADPSVELDQYEGEPPVLDENMFTLAELLNDVLPNSSMRQGPTIGSESSIGRA